MNDPTKTANGVTMVAGLRVFTNDWCWGIIVGDRVHVETNQNTGEVSHWHDVELEGKPGTRTYDGSRLSTVKPR